MKNIFLLLIAAVLLAACSTPKYTYNFDYYDYNSGRKQTAQKTEDVAVQPTSEQSPLIIQEEAVVAEANVPVVRTDAKADANVTKQSVAKRIASMSKTERQQLKKDVKEYIKSVKKIKNSDQSIKGKKAMDHDLKLAAIFGAVGLLLTLLGGIHAVFWVLGVIALVIGVVFFIIWLAKQ
jgi:hypothetical protein